MLFISIMWKDDLFWTKNNLTIHTNSLTLFSQIIFWHFSLRRKFLSFNLWNTEPKYMLFLKKVLLLFYTSWHSCLPCRILTTITVIVRKCQKHLFFSKVLQLAQLKQVFSIDSPQEASAYCTLELPGLSRKCPLDMPYTN